MKTTPQNSGLIDPFGRAIRYVRVSVTDRCNLRCQYCLPDDHKDWCPPESWLSYEEMVRILEAFVNLGVDKIRITGGEPLLRRDLHKFAAQISAIAGVKDLSLSTNAVLLKRQASRLREAGIQRLNISLDSLRADRFRAITRGGRLDKVLAGIEAARTAGFGPIKINMVVMNGINDDECGEMLDYCLNNGFVLRLIETMPVGQSGREAQDHYISLEEIKERLSRRYNLIPDVGEERHGPARYYNIVGERGAAGRIGLITPMSQHFCESCNRVRLGGDGTVYLCLGQNDTASLGEMVKLGADQTALQQAIVDAIASKPERHHFSDSPETVLRFMSQTGG